MLENSPTRPPRRVGDFVVSATVQVLFLAVLLLVPLYFTEAIDVHQLHKTFLAAPPPPPAPTAPFPSSRSVAALPRAFAVSVQLVVPTVTPRQIACLSG